MRENNKRYNPELIVNNKFKYATIVFVDSIGKCFTTMGNTLVNVEKEVFAEVRKEINYGVVILYFNNKLLGVEDVFLNADEFNYVPLPKQGYVPVWVLNQETGLYELSGEHKMASTISTLDSPIVDNRNIALDRARQIINDRKNRRS